MTPDVGRDLSLLGQLDHANRRRVSPLLARAAFQRRFKFPDRGIARTPDRIEWQARPIDQTDRHHIASLAARS